MVKDDWAPINDVWEGKVRLGVEVYENDTIFFHKFEKLDSGYLEYQHFDNCGCRIQTQIFKTFDEMLKENIFEVDLDWIVSFTLYYNK
jgi:hypothetical protein